MTFALGLVVAPVPSIPAGATTPGTPGTTQAGTAVFTEDFSNQNATNPISILNYSGGAAALGETYTADDPSGDNPGWVPSANQATSGCNGWILQSGTPQPTAGQDPQCSQPTGATAWSRLQALAGVLGTAQGLTPFTNQALAAYTNGDHGTGVPGYVQNPGVQFQTRATTIPVVAGHYYAASAWYAAINCGVSPIEQFAMLNVGGSATPTNLGPQINVCSAPGGTDYGSAAGTVRAVNIVSAAFKMPVGTSAVGLQLSNLNQNSFFQGAGYGNDGAFDTPTLIDVTPQLDKSFSPSTTTVGSPSTLTLTVTNTSELNAKADWSITDALPAGLRIASSPNIGGTCQSNPAVGTPFSVTAAPGSTSISATGGDLAAGQASCTITVDVTATATGSYTNGPANITTNLNPPGNATLTVVDPYNCTSVYTVDGLQHQISVINGTNGALTPAGVMLPGTGDQINALALSSAGSTMYAFVRTGPHQGKVVRFDPAAGTSTTYATTISAANANTTIGGAINPTTGIFYLVSGTTGDWKIFAFKTTTNAYIGQVGTIHAADVGSNGDIAFDSIGNLYLVTNVGGQAGSVGVIAASQLPTSPGTAYVTVANITNSLPTPSGAAQYAAAAFDSTGALVIGVNDFSYRVNPATGAILSGPTANANNPTDLFNHDFASCAYPNTVQVQKNLPNGRYAAGDQFTLKITLTSSGALAGNNAAATTVGTDSGLQNTAAETAGPVPGLDGTQYTVTETGAAGAVLSNYDTTWQCADTSNGNAVIASGSGTSGSFTMPTATSVSNVLCTFKNLPHQPSINVAKTSGAVTGPDANGVFTANYSVTVANTGTAAGTYGPLLDSPDFDINYTVQGASWTGASTGSANGSGPFTLAGAGKSIAVGATDTYNLAVQFKPTGLGTPSVCNGSPLAGLYNSVSAIGETGPATDNSACDAPPASINITKTAGAAPAVSGPDATGHFTVKYQINVTNSSSVAGAYGVLTDTPAFSSNIAPDGATWTTTGAGAPTGGSDATAPYDLTAGTSAIGAGVTHTYDIVVTFHFTDATTASACSGAGTGLFNSVAAASGETGPTTDNSACVPPPATPQPSINITKTAGAVSGPDSSGNYTATYTVKVINSGLGAGTYGTLTDTPAFAANLVPTGATWTTSGAGAPVGGSSLSAGPYQLAPAATAIAASTTHTYTLVVAFHFSSPATPAACSGPGTGLFNAVAVPAGQETNTGDNSACDQPPTRYDVFLHKVGSGAGGAPVSLAGSQWQLQADSSGAPGAVIAGGIQSVAGQTGEFALAALQPGTYWLAETTAPPGYALLAQPIRFVVSSSGGVTVTSGGSAAVSIGTTPTGQPEITVGDVRALTLPLAGGHGTKSFALAGLALLVLAALAALLFRRSPTSGSKPGKRVRK